jgi:hypothetical protein
MIHKDPDIVPSETPDLLFQIQSDTCFDSFFLVGGTAMALQIGLGVNPTTEQNIRFLCFSLNSVASAAILTQ